MEQQAKSTLERFCSWVHYENQRRYPDSIQYDIATYITRKELGPAGTVKDLRLFKLTINILFKAVKGQEFCVNGSGGHTCTNCANPAPSPATACVSFQATRL